MGWDEVEARWLARVLPDFRQLRTLLLSCNPLGDAGIAAVVAALPGGIEDLRLRSE